MKLIEDIEPPEKESFTKKDRPTGPHRAEAFQKHEAPYRLLLAQSNPMDVRSCREELSKREKTIHCETTLAQKLGDTLQILSQYTFDLILLDLNLADSSGIETFRSIQREADETPIIILTEMGDESIAAQALDEGALDYLNKSDIGNRHLVRSIQFAKERTRLVNALETAHQGQLHCQKMETLGSVTGGVAHDFNNLLAAISSNAELAELSLSGDDKTMAYIKRILIGCKRGSELCKQLLLYSGMNPTERKAVELNGVIRELSALISAALPRSTEVVFDLDKSLPLVRVDCSQIRQVIVNLLLNASEALEEQAGLVNITTTTQIFSEAASPENYWGTPITPNIAYIVLKIKDNGEGIDPKIYDRIFDPYFSTKPDGSGLGLATALGIVSAHEGTITVESSVCTGTLFSVYLPAEMEDSEPGLEKKSPPGTKRLAQKRSEKGHAIIADDEGHLRDAMHHYLEAIGFEPHTVCNGIDAVSEFEKYQDFVSIVIMDVNMPGLSGRDAYEQIIGVRNDTKVIFMSGYSDPKSDWTECQDANITYLRKPFSLKKLRDTIQALLGH